MQEKEKDNFRVFEDLTAEGQHSETLAKNIYLNNVLCDKFTL